MSDTVMNLYFCDLCNESIPQADLDLGRAVRRNERLICAACEAAMSGSHARPAAAPLPLSAAHVPQPVRDPGSGSSMAAIALAFSSVALVAGIGASAYLFWHQEETAGGFRQKLADLERSAPEPARTVSAALAEESRTRESEAAEARATIQALTSRLQELEQGNALHSALERRLDRLDDRFGLVDDLASRVQHQSGVIDQLSATMEALGAARAAAAIAESSRSEPAPRAEEPTPPASVEESPSWEHWLTDLASADSGTRWQAVQALGGTHDVRVVPHLVPMLADTDIFVRMAACRHLGDLGSVEAIPTLIDSLEDEEASVREAALVALRTLSGQSFPFDPLAREGDRSRRVKEWRDWWEQASKDPGGKGKGKSRN